MRLHLPHTGFDCVLTPRWGDPFTAAAVPWLAVAVVPLGLIVLLSFYEMRLVRWFVGAFLLGLRLSVVSLLLALVLLQPALAPVHHAEQVTPPRLLFVVDRTGSMDATDPQRSRAATLRLAKALRLHADLCSDLQLDEWIAAADGPARTDDLDALRQAEVRRLQDQLCARVDRLSRSDTVRRLLAADGGGLLKRLDGKAEVQLLAFAGGVVDAPPERCDDLFRWPAEGEKGAPGAVRRDFTDINLALEAVLQRAGQGSSPLRGVVLFSDGRQTGREPVKLELAERLAGIQAPLYPVVLGGAATPRPAIVVLAVDAQPIWPKDPGATEVHGVVTARVRVRGLPAGPLAVELSGKGGVLSRKNLPHGGDDGDYELTFPATLTDEGPQQLTVKPLPVAAVPAAEPVARSVEVSVVRDTAEVLLIDGEARWEYHYLAVALGRDPLVRQARSVVFEQPRIGKVPEADLDRLNWPATKLPPEPFALSDYDCVVLGDALPEQLPLRPPQPGSPSGQPKDDWARLGHFVRERGGTLVVVAGKRAMPLAFLEAGDGGRPHPLAELLPIEAPRVVRSGAGFPLLLSDEGRRNPLLQLGDGPDDTDALWAGLAPHYWAVVGRKKPAATLLAYYRGEDAGRVLTRAEREGQALIAWHTVGKGRVMFVGLDSTWRWRYKVGDQYHHRFWGQLVRWAMLDKLLTGQAGPVRFGTTRTRFEPGQEIDLRLRLDREMEPLGPGAKAEMRLLRVEEGKGRAEAARVRLEALPGQPRVLGATVRDLPPGVYELEPDVPDLAARMRSTVNPLAPPLTLPRLEVLTPESEELRDLTADPDTLRALAQRSGGERVYAPEEVGELLEALTRPPEVQEEGKPITLWQWWPTLLLAVGLLALEWTARKWAGLP